MERAALAKEVSIVASAANKRIKRLQTAGYDTPALRYTMAHGGKFSVKGKNKTQLLNELKRASGFMKAKTSTVRGAKKSIKKINEALSKLHPEEKTPDLTDEEVGKFWEAVDKLRALRPASFDVVYSQYTARIEKYIQSGRTPAQAASYIKRSLDKIDRELKQKQSEFDKEIEKYTSMGENSLNDNHL